MSCNDTNRNEPGTDQASAPTPPGAAPPDASSASDDSRNLYPLIFLGQVHGLNLSDPIAGAKAPIKPWNQRMDLSAFAESGTDDSMIITVPFTTPVTIKSILLHPGSGEYAPRRIRMFVNRIHGLDFDDLQVAEDLQRAPRSSGPAHSARLGTPPITSTSASASQPSPASEVPAPAPAPSAPSAPPPDAQGVSSLALGTMRSATRPGVTGDVRSGKPQADFALLQGLNGITEYPLGAGRFSNVNSISLVFVRKRVTTFSTFFSPPALCCLTPSRKEMT